MYFMCECGESFPEDQEGAREHVLEQHLDLIETRFEDFLDQVAAVDEEDDETLEEIYDEAVDDVQEDLLDCIPE